MSIKFENEYKIFYWPSEEITGKGYELSIHSKFSEKKYYLNGNLHRIGGPAFTNEFVDEYYQEGKLHRLDGFAQIRKTLSFFKNTYYVNNIKYQNIEHWIDTKTCYCNTIFNSLFELVNHIENSSCGQYNIAKEMVAAIKLQLLK